MSTPPADPPGGPPASNQPNPPSGSAPTGKRRTRPTPAGLVPSQSQLDAIYKKMESQPRREATPALTLPEGTSCSDEVESSSHSVGAALFGASSSFTDARRMTEMASPRTGTPTPA